MRRNAYIRLVALLTVMALCLCGCGNEAQFSPDSDHVELPDPVQADVQQILGDAGFAAPREVTLHFVSENSLALGSVTRSIQPDRNKTLVESVLAEVMTSASLSGSVEAKVLNVEEGSGVVTVNLSIEAGVNRGDQDYLLLCASIANTLLEIEGIEAVNVLTGGCSDPVCALPTGAFVDVQDNVAALYAQMQTEADRFLSESGGSSIQRNVLLYFPALGGEYLLPEVRELRFESADYLSPILEALSAGPLMRSCSFSAIPGSFELMEREPECYVSDAGERVADLDFSSMLTNYLDFAGVEAWQFYGSLVLTICSFVPEIDVVRISIDGIPVEGCTLHGRKLSFTNGMMRRSSFAEMIGSSLPLYFADGDSALVRAETPMAQSASRSPMQLLAELIEAADDPAMGVQSVFPDGIIAEDILGVSVEDRVASVNLSANFYALCQNLSAERERQLIYAMVNSLAELSEIGAVSFLVEGKSVDSLAQNIYLKTALLPDTGLVEGAGDEEVFF